MKNAVIYARFSCEKQTEMSIDGQVRVCTEFADKNGYKIINTYVDRATSGKTDQRKDFQRLLLDSGKYNWDAVIVYKLDRFARNRIESSVNRYTLKKNDVKLISAQENIPDTPEGVLLESLIEGLNEYYSLDLAQKVTRGLYECRRQGQFTGGRAPYGYIINDKQYYIDEYAAKNVRYVFDELSKGRFLKSVANEMKDIIPASLYWMSKNIKYTGCLMHNGEILENVIPAIISKEQFDMVQKLLDANSSSSYRPTYNYKLSGKVFCGECGNKVIGASGTSKTKQVYRYYKCKTPKKNGECSVKQISCTYLEDIIVDEALICLRDNKKIKAIANKTLQLVKADISNTDIKSLNKELKSIKRKKDNILEAIENIGYNNTFKERLTELDERYNQINSELENMKVNKTDIKRIENYLKSYLDNPPEELSDYILRDLVYKVMLFGDHVDIYFKNTTTPPEPPKPEKDKKSSSNSQCGSPQKKEYQMVLFFIF